MAASDEANQRRFEYFMGSSRSIEESVKA